MMCLKLAIMLLTNKWDIPWVALIGNLGGIKEQAVNFWKAFAKILENLTAL